MADPPVLNAEELLRSLARHEVDYELIGGMAIQAYGHVLDIDVIASWAPEKCADSAGRSASWKEPLEELTRREHDVLRLMAEGRSNHAIAEALVISGRAVEKHVTCIFTKLNLPGARGPSPRTCRTGVPT